MGTEKSEATHARSKTKGNIFKPIAEKTTIASMSGSTNNRRMPNISENPILTLQAPDKKETNFTHLFHSDIKIMQQLIKLEKRGELYFEWAISYQRHR